MVYIPRIHRPRGCWWTRIGDRDVGQAGTAGAAGAGADVRLPAPGGVRAADRGHLAAQRRAGLHDPEPTGAGRARRRHGGRRGRPRHLPRHRVRAGARCRRGSPRRCLAPSPRATSSRSSSPSRSPCPGVDVGRVIQQQRTATMSRCRTTPGSSGRPGREPGGHRRPRLEPGPRLAGLRGRGRDPLARPLRGPAPPRRAHRARWLRKARSAGRARRDPRRRPDERPARDRPRRAQEAEDRWLAQCAARLRRPLPRRDRTPVEPSRPRREGADR